MAGDGNPATPLLVACSLFREDFPWLYELAVQFARAYDRADRREIISIRENLAYFHKTLHRGPLTEIFGIRDEEAMSAAHQLIINAERLMSEAVERVALRPRVVVKQKAEAQPTKK